jgi:hypothetical protein
VKRKVMNKKRYRLKKVLYGLEQASQASYSRIKSYFTKVSRGASVLCASNREGR